MRYDETGRVCPAGKVGGMPSTSANPCYRRCLRLHTKTTEGGDPAPFGLSCSEERWRLIGNQFSWCELEPAGVIHDGLVVVSREFVLMRVLLSKEEMVMSFVDE